jgi:hypothetical protein
MENERKMPTSITTSFFDTENNMLGVACELLPIPLYKGMLISIHGCAGNFKVIDWSYHHGHPDEGNGLKIFLAQK